jgi:hypothetical protein
MNEEFFKRKLEFSSCADGQWRNPSIAVPIHAGIQESAM